MAAKKTEAQDDFLSIAIQDESLEFLRKEYPLWAKGLESRVTRGETAEQIYNYVLHEVGPLRERIAYRCKLAAAALKRSD